MAEISISQILQQAIRHHQAEQLPQAELLYREILARVPNQPDALHFLGVIAYQSGKNEQAVGLIRRAIALRPNYTDAYSNLGNALKACGQLDESIVAFRRAIVLDPTQPESHNNLGTALRDKGLADEAMAAFQQAIALRPGYHKALSNIGICLQDKGQPEQAIAAYQRALAVKPDYAEGFANLGNALKEKGDLDSAIAACRHAAALKPDYAEAYNFLGIALSESGQLDDAITAFSQAVICKPSFVQAHSNLLFALNYHPAYDNRAIARETARWNQQHAEPLRKFILPHANDRTPHRRLRIGYVSSDLTAHPVGRFLLPLLSGHDRQQFEVFAYARVSVPDSITEQLRSHADYWRNISGFSDQTAADLIRQDRIDILVDLSLHSARHHLLVFARRPAPVQVSYLGYCGTTGMTEMDYRLSDPHFDPVDDSLPLYSEKTIRLPRTYWCYSPRPSPEPAPPPVLKNKFITFGCLNNFAKVSPPAIELWAHILLAVPDSHMIVHAQPGRHRDGFIQRMKRMGVTEQRITFMGKQPWDDYCSTYSQVDIALDPFPFAGGITTCDALWMGVPVVTLSGATAVGRGGRSVLSNIGLSDLIASTPDQYARVAINLAMDVDRMQQLRSEMRKRMVASPLMDVNRFAGDVEAAFREMWRIWCTA